MPGNKVGFEPFQRHSARKPTKLPYRGATINGRPAWQVAEERRKAQEKGEES